MEEKEFNLLDEKWIRVINKDCSVQEVSITDALIQAHTFSDLAGEMPMQDVAVLRVLLAILHTVFSRVDELGEERRFQKSSDALKRWGALWKMKKFPEEPIRDYLNKYHERFYLFHPERPFWQVKEANVATEYGTKTMNGLVSESNNKFRLFSPRAGSAKDELSYAEAARWLIYTNSYDNSSLKKTKGIEIENNESIGPGWLAKLGVVVSKGDNLFETLMLNLVLCNEGKLWGEERPIWELEKPRSQQRCKIPQPDNPAELLTLQCRRLLLTRNENKVVGYHRMSGDFFDSENVFVEQMTLWKNDSKNTLCYYPKIHDTSKQIWREFSTLIGNGDEKTQPGVLSWQKILQKNHILEKERLAKKERLARFSCSSVEFDSKKSTIVEVYNDELSFCLDILSDVWKEWKGMICTEAHIIEELAQKVNTLEIWLDKAEGIGKKELESKQNKKKLQEQFYFYIDIPFRKWLANGDPEKNQIDEYRNEWRKIEKKIATDLKNEIVQQASITAYIGRTIKEKWKNKDEGEEENHYYNVPEACNWFEGSIQKLLGKLKEEGIMEMTDECRAVGNYVESKLNEYSRNVNEGYVRAHLAQLRRGIGRIPGDAPEIWGILFADMPEEMMSRNDKPTKEEWAVYTALTLYALHQQGNDIQKENMYRQNFRLGLSVAGLVKDEKKDRERIAGRFNAFATANDMQEAAYYLRGLIQLLRAANIPLDYVRLAQELYRFQDPDEAPKVWLAWGQDFYRMKKSETKEEKENA